MRCNCHFNRFRDCDDRRCRRDCDCDDCRRRRKHDCDCDCDERREW